MSTVTSDGSAPIAQTGKILDDPRCDNRRAHPSHLHEVQWWGKSKTVPQVVEEYWCPGSPIDLFVVRRKICKEYDSVCLEGGCGYCQFGRWRRLDRLEKEVMKSKNMKHIGSFIYGKRKSFHNAPLEFNDGSRVRPYSAARV